MSPKDSPKSRRFLWLGNSPALDFVNTLLVQDGRITDLLESGEDLVHWLREAGFWQAGHAPKVPPATLNAALVAARQYRGLLRSGLDQLVESGSIPSSLVWETNALLARRTREVRLMVRGKKYSVLNAWEFREPDAWVVPIADSFAGLLSQAQLSRIRRCKNPECLLFFYDISKSGTRSWCSLSICGNKLRVAAFRKSNPGRI